jgi:hypothetical protein
MTGLNSITQRDGKEGAVTGPSAAKRSERRRRPGVSNLCTLGALLLGYHILQHLSSSRVIPKKPRIKIYRIS